jgi:hypothetical protein
MVGVAQLETYVEERWTVNPEAAGSNPVAHPKADKMKCSCRCSFCLAGQHKWCPYMCHGA